jgi:uncharacterized phage-associated protein
MNDEAIETLDETGRWRARDVTYWAGPWSQVKKQIPTFKTDEFRATEKAPANPHLNVVVRVPRSNYEQPVPVGTVSKSYTLAQHAAVGEMCLEGIREAGVAADSLRCELGLTELGEWMNLRIYFPKAFSHMPKDGQQLDLRLECFNSVDGSSRLVIFLGWLRFVCSNGLVIGETKVELRDIHNMNMNLGKIPSLITDGLEFVQKDVNRISLWEGQQINRERFVPWVNKTLTGQWNKTAACRVFHICESGEDIKISEPFAPGEATEKPIVKLGSVPGAAKKAVSLYDVSQALSWVATKRNNPEEKVEWQLAIPKLIEQLGAGI